MQWQKKQYRRCMYNEILRGIRVTIFFCNGNATMNSVYCLATCHCQQYNNIRRCTFLWRIPFAERNVGRSSCKMFDILRSFNQILIFSAIFTEVSNIKFHENPYNRSRADTWGKTVGRADTTKLIGTFRYVSERA